jgi:hypothetical protein
MQIRNKVFEILWAFLPVILVAGLFIRWAMVILHNLTSGMINLLSTVYTRLDAAVSRSIEFRCDRQTAKAIGWQSIFIGLSSLPIYSRSNMFDSHPDGVSRLLYVHRRGTKQPSQQLVSGSILARLTALLLYPMLFLLAWWLGEVAEALPQGYFSPVFQTLMAYFYAIPCVTTSIQFLADSGNLLKASLSALLTWSLQESTYLWPWIQAASLTSWHFVLNFHHNLLSHLEQLYQQFTPLLNDWIGWQRHMESTWLKWLPMISTLLTELLWPVSFSLLWMQLRKFGLGYKKRFFNSLSYHYPTFQKEIGTGTGWPSGHGV